MKTDRSSELRARALEVIPGGVNSPVRAFAAVGGDPIFLARGKGSHVWDADDNEYIDFLSSWGPLILGHAPDRVLAVLTETAALSTSFGASTEREVEFAELLTSLIPSLEKVRLVNSGTEATMSAIRLARAFTGRDKIIKFAGCYHGHADGLLVKAGSGALTHGIPTSAGVPESYASETLVADFNDIESVEKSFLANPTSIAAIIIEPVAGNMGVVPPADGFLADLRKITQDNGALLIFDEVITGFRVGPNGAQGLFGITPDITTMGKIIGGGLPVGAYGGREDIMQMVAPLGAMYQAGTLSGNPLAVSAGIATLTELQKPGTFERLDTLAQRFTDGVTAAFQKAEIPSTINRVGSMFTGFFNPGPVAGLAAAEGSDTEIYGRYFHAMQEQGVYIAPSQFECGFVSTAHTETDIDTTIDKVSAALSNLR